MSKEKSIEYIKRAMDCIDELPFSDNGMLAFYDLEIAVKELEDWKMSVLISPEAYKKLLQGDLNWLFKQPESLEKDHIEAILKNLIKRIDEGKDF